MNYLLGGALLFGACGLVAKSFIRKKVIGDDDRFDMVTARPGRGRSRSGSSAGSSSG